MHNFTRQPTRYDIQKLHTPTPESRLAREQRELEAQQRRIDAAIRAERAARPWPVRVVLGLVDVVREWVGK
jgi:predicted transposase YdaD